MGVIGISTDIGYNYGSLLQAFATKTVLTKIGYESEIFHLDGSLIKVKDVRVSKLLITAFRMILHSENFVKSISLYKESFSKELDKDTIQLFNEFISNQLKPINISLNKLRRASKSDYYTAFLCGSDQIWITDSFYIDPFYYLSFAPEYKRIAFAPSFGREFVPKYNKKPIAEKLSKIPYLSVREATGVNIVQSLVGRTPELLIDPSLLLTKKEWESYFIDGSDYGDYLLAYFLDEPSEQIIRAVRELAEQHELKIVGIPYGFSSKYSDIVPTDIGPFDFVRLISKANLVCTDSFHGTAFSLNLGRPFYTFERNYCSAVNQSTRIKSLLYLTGTTNRYSTPDELDNKEIDFEFVGKILDYEREKAVMYLNSSIKGVLEHGK